MKVKDLNIFDEFAVVKNETVLEAAKLMKKADVPDLILVDDHEKPLGIISAVDMVLKVIAEEKDPSIVKVATIARKVKVFEENSSRDEVFKYMTENEIEIVPIVKKNGELLGVCTIGDVLLDIEDEE
ncbi:MAG: CBS domain-containing protein [Candidatus Helarchaeota archaeon]